MDPRPNFITGLSHLIFIFKSQSLFFNSVNQIFQTFSIELIKQVYKCIEIKHYLCSFSVYSLRPMTSPCTSGPYAQCLCSLLGNLPLILTNKLDYHPFSLITLCLKIIKRLIIRVLLVFLYNILRSLPYINEVSERVYQLVRNTF